jgi:hypothetical protein
VSMRSVMPCILLRCDHNHMHNAPRLPTLIPRGTYAHGRRAA